jgi:hypothetical protein
MAYTYKERLERNKLRRRKLRENSNYRKKENDRQRERDNNNLEAYLLRVAKSRAKKRNIPFSINKKDIIIPTHCPLLGIKLKRSRKRLHPNSYSLDRINNDKGYIPGNVLVISQRANILKNNATLEELQLLVKNLTDYWTH